METLKARKEMNPSYMWDLSTLYTDDAAFETEMQQIDSAVHELTAYQGKLKDAHSISEFLRKNLEVSLVVNNLFTYAQLRRTEDLSDPSGQSMYARSYACYVNYVSAVSFYEPELLSLDDEVLQDITKDSELEDFAFYLQDLIRQKPHMLSSKEEKVIASFGEVFGNSQQIYESLTSADMKFENALDSGNNPHEVSNSSFILLQNSTDRILRKNAFCSLYKSYREHINTFASLYSGCVKAAVTEAALRGYDSSRQMSMFKDNIPESVYDNLIDTIHRRMDVMYRYIRLRKRLLKIEELHYYDLYTPLVADLNRHFTYEQAQQMVIDAVKPLGNAYVDRVKKAYEDQWLDVYPNIGKGTGAFSSGTYTSNPFIMLNYTGTLESVSTLAHEMGHSQHTWLSNHNQPAQYSNYTMFVAEVASTVNENLLIEHLLENEKEPEHRLSLLNQYMESFKGTIFRQTMFAEFEKKAHEMAENGNALNAENLNALYLELIHLYFGDDLVIDEEVQYEWARIPHFYYLFYVYVYATGYSSACAITEKILTEGSPAVDAYLQFLSMGSSAYPLDELKYGGVDLNSPEPIHIAIDKFNAVIEEAEKLADEMGLGND